MLAWAGHIGDGHQRLSSGSHHPTWLENWAKSHTGGSPGGKRYGQVAGSCKPHLLYPTFYVHVPLQSLPTCAKCLRPRRRPLRQGRSVAPPPPGRC